MTYKSNNPNSNDSAARTIGELTEEGSNFLRLATLIVDINYRHKTQGKSLDWINGRGYSKDTIKNRLGSNVSPVEDGFLGM